MVVTVRSLGLNGIAGYAVSAECFLSGGLPAFDIVGLPDTAVREARERVVTESVNGVMHEAHRLYFLYFALFAESFLDILQVCSASGEYDSGE